MQNQSFPAWLALLIALILLTLTTAFSYQFYNQLDITSITLLYLLTVITIAYFFQFMVACLIALMAFLAINYFFTEPRFTFTVAHAQSWTSLCCFLIVSMLIASLVKQLKYQTQQALIASKRAMFSRTLAEKLSLSNAVDTLFVESCHLLQTEFNKPFAVLSFQTPQNAYTLTNQVDNIEPPDSRLVDWVVENGKAISPYTDYWTETMTHNKQWLIPFIRFPSREPILVVGNIQPDEPVDTYVTIKSCVDQISQSYQRLINHEKAKQAELTAQEEAIQSAFLASISHDMRTPLTTILGAASTLQHSQTDTKQRDELSRLITTQARYLANTTENILSLIRLESQSVKDIPMDWQSPEELIGLVMAVYQNREETVSLNINMHASEYLIKGNAHLLMQALVNLIDNARRAMQIKAIQNGNQLAANEAITIEVVQIDQRIQISVKDRGNGFDENFNSMKIKKFNTSNHQGFGLGLSIVQAIAQCHEATFTLNNREGGGACAMLSFATFPLNSIRT